MNRRLIALAAAALLILGGCEQLKEQAQNLRKSGENAINGISQEAQAVKNKVMETKAAIDAKSQQLVNAVDAVNKFTH